MQPDHHDPFTEAHQRVLERVMALAAMTEAAARLTARGKERREELQRQMALEQAQLRQRLSDMPILDVAKTWRTAQEHAGTDKAAVTVRNLAEGELRRRWPDLMGIYDDGIRQGLDPIQAMQAAGLRHAENLVWNEHPDLRRVYDDARKRGRTPADAMADAMAAGDARPHGGTNGWSGSGKPGPQSLPDSPSPLGRELVMVSQWMDPAVRAQWVAALRDTSADPAAVAWAEQLLDQAGKQIATGSKQAGEPDLRATTNFDEHTQGLNGSVVSLGRGELNTELAAAVGNVASSSAGASTSGFVRPSTAPPLRPAAPPSPPSPPQLARMSFAERAEKGLIQGNSTRAGAGKTIEGQLVASPVQHRTRGNR